MRLFKYIIFLLLLTSCSSTKNLVIEPVRLTDDSINQLIEIARRDLKGKIFIVSMCHKSSNNHCYEINSIENKVLRFKRHELNSFSNDFPTCYFTYRNKIFFVNDPQIKINTRTINMLNRLGLLESLYYEFSLEEINQRQLSIKEPVTFYENIKVHNLNLYYKPLSVEAVNYWQ